MSEALLVVQCELTDIHPAPWNVRTGHAVEAIAESIRINGFRDPIEVWRKTAEIVAGEGRYLAAQFLELEAVPVIYHDFDSLASAKRYALANNRLTDRSAFDLPALQEQLGELESLAGTGFEELPTIGLPDGRVPAEPQLESECLVEIRCGREALGMMRPALDEWTEVDGVTIDIS